MDAGGERRGCQRPCYQLTDAFQGDLRVAMGVLRDVRADVPALRWLAVFRQLRQDRSAIQGKQVSPLDLDWHGNSKLPDEREAWTELLRLLEPQVVELRAGRPGPEVVYDESDFRRILARTTVGTSSTA